MYSTHVLGYDASYTACAVLPHGTPVHHLNERSMTAKVLSSNHIPLLQSCLLITFPYSISVF
jgi:hypothetical protein